MRVAIAGFTSPVVAINSRPTVSSPQSLSLGLAMVMAADGMSVILVINPSSLWSVSEMLNMSKGAFNISVSTNLVTSPSNSATLEELMATRWTDYTTRSSKQQTLGIGRPLMCKHKPTRT